jgi:trigger factor
MKIVKSDREGNTVFLSVEEDIQAAVDLMDVVYPRVAKTTKVNGFREGKVPRAVFERNYGQEAIMKEAVIEAIEAAYQSAIKALDLKVVDSPNNVNIEPYDLEKPIQFSCELTVQPTIKLGKYKGLKLEKADVSVSDSDVEAYIADERKRQGKFEPVAAGDTHAIGSGDMVRFSMVATCDGTAYDLWTRETSGTIIGKGPYGPEFDAELEGLTLDAEKTFSVAYSDEFNNPDVQGKTVEFQVKITQIQSWAEPELTDEWVASISEHKSVDLYYAAMREKLQKEREDAAVSTDRATVITAIVESLTIDVPPVMVEQEIEQQFRQFSSMVQRQGLSLDQYCQFQQTTEAHIKENFRPDAEKSVKERLVIKAVADAETIVADDADLDAYIQSLNVAQFPDLATCRQHNIDEELFRGDVISRKTLDFLVSETKWK